MLIRLVDFLRKRVITAFFVGLTSGGHTMESTDECLSSIVDTWLLLSDIELEGERNRGLYVLKSRGMAHSNQVREFLITSQGLRLVPTYLGPTGGLTGSARLIQEAQDAAGEKSFREEIQRKQLVLDYRRQAVEAQVEALRAGFEAEKKEFGRAVARQRRSPTRSSPIDWPRPRAGRQEKPGKDDSFMKSIKTARQKKKVREAPARTDKSARGPTKTRRGVKAVSAVPGPWLLRLYVAGQTANSLTAFSNLKSICDAHLSGHYEIEVIDLTKAPQRAHDDQIGAVPTLVRKQPEPIKRAIGNLSNVERVLVGMEVPRQMQKSIAK